VILDDGVDFFLLEIDANGPVTEVRLPGTSVLLVPPQPGTIVFRDDGAGGDRAAGDFVFTAGPFRFNTAVPITSYLSNPESPPGMDHRGVGTVEIEELDGTVSTFLFPPVVGVLSASIPLESPVALAPDVAMTPHLVNISTSDRAIQRFLHVPGLSGMPAITNRYYEIFPDQVDMFVFFSMDRAEMLPSLIGSNFVTGVHSQVRTDYTGGTQAPFDASATYGSGGRLLGINAVDILNRGLVAGNVVHEITHQWAAQVDASFGMTDGSHYKPGSSAASQVGGFQWVDQGGGSFLVDCTQGRNGGRRAPPFDRYMAGFLDFDPASEFSFYKKTAFLGSDCGTVVAAEDSVDIQAIQALQGVRSPGSSSARHDFRLGFVAESHDRLLTPVEMTYYEIMAAWLTAPVPAGDPDPDLRMTDWVSMNRYWGPGVTWTGEVPSSTTAVPTTASGPAVLSAAPNPFTTRTTIRFENPRAGRVRLSVFDLRGRRVAGLLDRFLPAGAFGIPWEGTGRGGRPLPSGVYFYRLESDAGTSAGRVQRVR